MDTSPNVIRGDAQELRHLFPEQKVNSLWSSPEAFARYVSTLKKENAWHNAGWQTGGWRDDWTGTKNMEEAQQIAANGWVEGAENVEKVRKYIQARNPMMKQPVRYDIAGSIPCVPRAVAGDPKNMRVPGPAASRRRPVITLLVHVGATCGVSKDVLNNQAAAVCAIVDQIEAAGYACEVIATSLSKSRKLTVATTIIAKPSYQPVDVKRLSFVLGHSSFFRRLVFADWGANADCKDLGSGLGGSHAYKQTEEFVDKNIYILPDADKNTKIFKTMELAATDGVDYLLTQLHEQKCPPFLNYIPKEPKKDEETPEWEPDWDDDDDDF